eukprot:Skav233447  [mRNA]  locus=scaffold1486:354982:358935:- [translate_table: standard]
MGCSDWMDELKQKNLALLSIKLHAKRFQRNCAFAAASRALVGAQQPPLRKAKLDAAAQKAEVPEEEVITPTQRRRHRKKRALARHSLWLHRTGWVKATRERLQSIRHRLSSHHSRDPGILLQLQAAMAVSWEKWKCEKCGSRNEAAATYCPTCGKHWKTLFRPRTPRQPAKTPDWNQNGQDAQSDQAQNPRRRSKKAKKDKEKKKEQQAPAPTPPGGPPVVPPPAVLAKAMSPFGYASSSAAGPWTAQEPTPFQGMGQPSQQQMTAAMAANSELVTALKQAYQGREDAMPPHVKEVIEKQETEASKNVTRQLHQATTSLGKARKQLGEVNEAKKVLRTQWLQHLKESTQSWETQLQEYRTQLAALQGQATKAHTEVTSARKLIHQLNSKTATESLPDLTEEPEEPPQDSSDLDEEQARKQLGDVLRAFASSLGVDVAVNATAVPIESDSDLGSPKSKEPKRGHTETAYEMVDSRTSSSTTCAAGVGGDQVPSFATTLRSIRDAWQLRTEVLWEDFYDVFACIFEWRRNDEFYERPEGMSTSSDATDDDALEEGAEGDLNEDPGYLGQLRHLLHEWGAAEQLEEGPVAYLNTYFLHGADRRRSTESRVLRLVGPPFRWRAALQRLWEDVLRPDVHWDAKVVYPDLPEVPTMQIAGHLVL